MWIKLGSEHINLDHIVRIRFSTGWKGGQEEVVAELEAFVEGEAQVFCRYRGPDAEMLYSLLQSQASSGLSGVPRPTVTSSSQAGKNTIHDLQLP